jgi:hypothetical protein
MRKASDIYASVFVEIGIHGGLGTKAQRRAVLAVVLQVIALYRTLGRADFEQNSEVDNLLAWAESMKTELMKTYLLQLQGPSDCTNLNRSNPLRTKVHYASFQAISSTL